MKNKTALKQSLQSVKLLCLLVPVCAALVWMWPNWFTILALSVLCFTLLMDGLNIVHLRRKADRDPGYLKRNIP